MSRRVFARASELFDELRGLELAVQTRRLDEACGGDRELRQMVEDMLDGARNPLDGLDEPLFAFPPAGDEPLPERIGAYRILGAIGPGGMGMVYRAQQENPTRIVALKVIRHALLTDENRRRFWDEIETLGQLNHPGIARVYAGGSDEGPSGSRPFFVMEYVEGDSLTEHAAGLDVHARMALLVEVCEAVRHAHGQGVIHCDLKPANILVDEHGRPKVLDFGIARWIGGRAEAARNGGTRIGTPAYMSPEQRAGGLANTRWDVFALGVLGQELAALDGSPRKPPAPGDRGRSFDRRDARELAAVLRKARAKAPDERYDGADALADDLRRWLEDEPTRAFAGGRWHRWVLFQRRNRKLVVSLALAQFFLVGGVLGTSWQWRRAAQAATRAEAQAAKKQAAVEFLGEIFRLAQPEGALGEEITMADALARSEELAPRVLGGEPEVLALVRSLVGSAYGALGRYAAAERNLVAARDALSAELGGTSAATLEVELELASLLALAERRAEARAHLDRMVARTRAALGPTHQLALRARYELASCAVSEGRFAEAGELLEEVLRQQVATLGARHRETLMTRGTLGTLRCEEGRTDEALALLQETLAAMSTTLGPTHPLTLVTRSNLASLYADLDRYDDALTLAREELESTERVMGGDHPHALISRGNVATLIGWSGDLVESEALLRDVLADCERLLGSSHPVTLVTRHNLTDILTRAGKVSEAAEHGRATLDGRRTVLGRAHEHTLLTLSVHCIALRRLGEHAEAARELRRALDDMRMAPEADGSWRVRCLNALARSLLALDELDEAGSVLAAAFEANPGGPGELPDELAETRRLEQQLDERLQAATR